jgi:FkbM family methyltransferase
MDMNLSQRLSNILLLLYKNLNQTGILDFEWAQSAFVSSYFAYKKYLEDSTAKLVKNFPALFQEGHILDVGANIGYTASIFSKVLTSPYKLFAFEPEKRNVRILKKVAKNRGFAENLIITAAAVGETRGEIEIWQNDGHHADHRVLTAELRSTLKPNVQTQKTPLITLDHFLETQQAITPIAFIKIDVQGYELAVCRGMEKTLAANPHCVIWFEYCPSMIAALGYRPQELLHFFQDKNYLFYQLNKNGTLDHLRIDRDNPLTLEENPRGYVDILCSPKGL